MKIVWMENNFIILLYGCEHVFIPHCNWKSARSSWKDALKRLTRGWGRHVIHGWHPLLMAGRGRWSIQTKGIKGRSWCSQPFTVKGRMCTHSLVLLFSQCLFLKYGLLIRVPCCFLSLQTTHTQSPSSILFPWVSSVTWECKWECKDSTKHLHSRILLDTVTDDHQT